MEAMRCLKRRISDAVYRQLVADAHRADQPSEARVREGTAGRLFNPARSTFPRISTLRISHFPDPRQRRYNPARPAERSPEITSTPLPLDDRGEPEGCTGQSQPMGPRDDLASFA